MDRMRRWCDRLGYVLLSEGRRTEAQQLQYAYRAVGVLSISLALATALLIVVQVLDWLAL